MFPIACYQATGQYFAHSALNDRFPAILNAQNPAIPSAHPQILLFLVFLSGFAFIGKLFISDIAETRTDQKQPYIEMKEQFNQIYDRLNLIEYPELQTVKVHMEKIKEDIRYSTSEYLDETKDINIRLSNHLAEIQTSIKSIENLKLNNNNDFLLLEPIKILSDQLGQLDQIISERERLTKLTR